MKIFWQSIMLVVSLLLATSAFAQNAIPAVNGKCPSGWGHPTNGYCSTYSNNAQNTIVRVNSSCPSGWRKSGDYCTQDGSSSREAREDAKRAAEWAPIAVDSNGRCPANRWRSGGSCIRSHQ